jgi:hypothetical protein
MSLIRRSRLQAPGGPDFPAGFFTGPLGSDNILPADEDGALVGLWTGFEGQTQQGKIDRWEALQTAAGRTIDVLAFHYGGGGTVNGIPNCAFLDDDVSMDWAITNGSGIYLSWTPERSTVNKDSVVLQMVNGQRDACLDFMADHLAGKGIRIMLRAFWEFNFEQFFRRGDGTPVHDRFDPGDGVCERLAVHSGPVPEPGRDQRRVLLVPGREWRPHHDRPGLSRQRLRGLGGVRPLQPREGIFSACDFFGWAHFWRIFNQRPPTVEASRLSTTGTALTTRNRSLSARPAPSTTRPTPTRRTIGMPTSRWPRTRPTRPATCRT